MRKLIKKILRENEWDWANKVEPKLTKGLILCPNHEKFRGGCKEVLKVDKVRDRYAPDKLVYLKDLETGNRYADTIKKMMQWLSDGEFIIAYQPLKESDDFDWIKDEKLNLGQYFDSGNFNKGDEFTLMGELMGGFSNSPKNWSNEPFKVVINTVGEIFRDCTFNISIDYCDAVKKMEISRDCNKWPENHIFLNNYFVDEDRDLTVISHKNDKNYIHESTDFDWVENINPIPNEILNINKYPKGDYKVWLGDIPKEQQLLILDYIIDLIEGSNDLTTSSSLYSIRDSVENDEAYFNSLYFDIYPPESFYKKKSIVVAMMAWYPEQGWDKYEGLERCRKYFDNHEDTELSTVKIKE